LPVVKGCRIIFCPDLLEASCPAIRLELLILPKFGRIWQARPGLNGCGHLPGEVFISIAETVARAQNKQRVRSAAREISLGDAPFFCPFAAGPGFGPIVDVLLQPAGGRTA
jgi:hypothetical protein